MNRTSEIENLINIAFKTMLDNTRDMVFVKDVNSVYVAASMPFVKMVGKEWAEEIIGHTDLEIFEDKDLAKRYLADDKKLFNGGRDLVDYIEPITDDHGQARYGSTSKFILRNSRGEILGILGITKDITRDYIARQHYQRELKYLFELPADTYAVSYIDIDGWRIISQRRQSIDGREMKACYTIEDLCNAALEAIVDKDCEAAKFYSNFAPDILWNIYSGGKMNLSFKYQLRLSDDSIRWVHSEVRFLTEIDSGHLCAMLSAKDIDAEKKQEQKIYAAATMDRMTMLLNRETTMESIEDILEKEHDRTHVLYMIDIDNFKMLNDTLGHQAGDEFLIALSAELKKVFRESDVVGRIGGDEFFALMRTVNGMHKMVEKAKELLITIQDVCKMYPNIPLSGSIGISIYPENGKSLEELYAQADAALYQAKRKGKNQFVFAPL
ncbi:MAG: GGDEF domain-containing protein [Lachnospiraceae bacterium]|nr:GGDEF domain-containing protein [Lachnospiraceae bacterium]